MREITFGIIGCGMIANIHALALQGIEGCKAAACFDSAPERAAAFAAKHGVKGYTDLGEFLAHPGLDAVTIATPSGLHLEPGLAAIAAGKHLMVEKPLEITVARCDQLIAAAEARGVLLGGIFHSRFFEVPRLIKEAVEADRLGGVALADAQVKWFRSQDYYDSGAWRGTWKLDGGGALMNQSIHAVDLLQWFMGPVLEVTGRIATLAHQRIEVEDTAVATLRFANGALGVIEGTTCAYPGSPKRLELLGPKGSIIMEEDSLTVWNFVDSTPEDMAIRHKHLGKNAASGGAADPSSVGHLGHQLELADFADAIRNRRPPFIDGREARKAVEIIEAIYRSAREGKSVALPLEA